MATEHKYDTTVFGVMEWANIDHCGTCSYGSLEKIPTSTETRNKSSKLLQPIELREKN